MTKIQSAPESFFPTKISLGFRSLIRWFAKVPNLLKGPLQH